MNLYPVLAIAHAGFGTVALLAFWTAGFARKGSPLHMRAGKIFLLAMVALMVFALPMSLIILARGQTNGGAFLLYLLLITATAAWLSWRAIRDKRDWARFTGPVYRVLAWLNLLGGIGIACFGLFAARQMQWVMVGYSLIGILLFVRMRKFAAQPPGELRWWMRWHMNAMLGNGIATHIAFLSIGLPRLLPVLHGPAYQNIAWLGPIGIAVLAGAYLSRKYLPTRRVAVAQ